MVLSACIHYAGVIFYAIFASGELQPWADPKAEEEKQWNQLNETYSIRKKSIVSTLIILESKTLMQFFFIIPDR